MSTQTFFSGLSRIVSSAKLQTAVYATTVSFFAVKYIAPTVDPAQKALLWAAFFVAVLGLFGVVINGWAKEDAATAAAAAPPAIPAPSTTVVTGDHASVAQTPKPEKNRRK